MCNVHEKERVGGLGTTKQAKMMLNMLFGLLMSFFFLSFFILFNTNQHFIDIDGKLQDTRQEEINHTTTTTHHHSPTSSSPG